MKDERIEEILQDSFPKGVPDGMRERVLGRAVAEIRPVRSRFLSTVKIAFAAAAICIIALANISDSARCYRIAGGADRQSAETIARSIAEQRRLAQEIYSVVGVDPDEMKARESL